MSIAAYGDPALEIRPASSFVGFLAAFASLAPPRNANWAEVEAEVASGELDIGRGIEAMTRLLANSRAAAEKGEHVPWEYLIERLAFCEMEAARELTQMRRLVKRISAWLNSAAPAIRTRARALTRRQEDAIVRFVEAVRDARWQAMAGRAHFDAASRGGPIFDDVSELRRYLENA